MNAREAINALRRSVPRGAGRHDRADIRALQQLAPIISGYLPWSGSAIAPQTAMQVCNELALNERRTVMELGAGASTLLMAMWAESEKTPIRVTSIDEDDSWIRLMRDKLKRFKYAEVNLVLAPLTPFDGAPHSLPVNRWYDAGVIDRLEGGVDMLLVDGPTAYRAEWAFDRWPALPRLLDRLSPACAVLLDDTSRRGEAAVLRSWLASHPEFAARQSGPATWLSRGPAWQV